ncbi:hypothetical protein SAMN02745866_03041 [Alteromonadaceae bacterium Bs31]|nr:hypothetical protein SAMN02745866_03041 [Alteromonadaceae bacterium Bs31]
MPCTCTLQVTQRHFGLTQRFLCFRSINCFANDGKLDASELRELFSLAKRDGVVDDNEKRVLSNIIKKINTAELDEDMMKAMQEIKEAIK